MKYKGLKISAAGRIHDLAFKEFLILKQPPDSAILDIGAGNGAFSLRLKDNGYTNIEALEFYPDRFKVQGIKCYSYDLNKSDLSTELQHKFDIIFAIEIIEHLNNPGGFINNIAGILNPGGLCFISSPNVASWYSRLLFLRHGTLDWFNMEINSQVGHIHPVFEWQIELFAGQTGLTIFKSLNSGNNLLVNKRIFQYGYKALFRPLTYLYMLLAPLMKNPKGGENKLWVLQKAF